MFFRLKQKPTPITEGSVFERTCHHNIVERATVVWVGNGPFGIEHVRFKLSTGASEPEDMRILAADAFRERYPQLCA